MHHLLVLLGWFVGCEVGGHTTAVLKGCCFQDSFKTACSILVQFPSSFFSLHFVSIHVVHPYSSTDTPKAWKKSHFILSKVSNFQMINNQSIAVYTITRCMLTSLSVDEILLPRYVNWSHYNIYFWTNTLGKNMNPQFSPAMF